MALHINLREADDPRDVVHRAVQALAEGQLVVFPTETVYGVAASALSAEGVEKLKQLKLRGSDSPFALAIKSCDSALDYVPDLPPLAARLARRCWPGPVTLVVRDDHPDGAIQQLPDSVRQAVAPGGTVGLRVPEHPLILAVLRLLAGPLVLTSANRAGQPEAISGQQAIEALDDQVAMIIDDGPSKYQQASSVVRVDESGLSLLRAGVVNDAALRRLASLMIVLVCTGNTCRSPMAAALLRRRLAEHLGCSEPQLEERGLMVLSAGIAAMAGAGASPEAVQVMSQRRIDLSDHESQPLDERTARFADLILTMTRGHRDAICAQWPDAAPRVRQICLDGQDVSDPIGGPQSMYRQCADQIDGQLAAWMAHLEREGLIAPPADASPDNKGE